MVWEKAQHIYYTYKWVLSPQQHLKKEKMFGYFFCALVRDRGHPVTQRVKDMNIVAHLLKLLTTLSKNVVWSNIRA